MKNALSAAMLLSGFAAACSTPSTDGTGTGGTGTSTGGATTVGGGAGTTSTGGTTGGSAGTTSTGATGGTTGGTAGGASGATGGASGAATTTGGVGGVGGGTGGSTAGTGTMTTGGVGGTGGAEGGASGAGGTPPAGGAGGAGPSGGMSGSDASGGMGGTAAGAGGTSAGASGTAGSGGKAACMAPTVSLSGNDAVDGELITFNDNGCWCWYQDERVIVDTAKNKMVVGSVASGSGAIQAVVYDIAAKSKSAVATLGTISVDDHSAPAFAIGGDGSYTAMWAGHRVDCNSYYNVYNGSSWSAKKQFDWKAEGCPWDSDSTHMITYSNLWYLSAESKFLSGVRSISTSPSMLQSTDNGGSFSYYGRISATPTTGYVAGYYKYWGNGTDRIDFVGTEAHPRDNDNNLWHGYYKGGKLYKSDGTVVDDTAADKTAKNVDQFTKVFATGGTVGSVKISHAWNADLVRYADGTLALIWTGRANTTTSTDNPDLRLLYARFDGTSWKTTYLVKAGPKLYDSEQDYTGLGALVPDDPTTIYISSPYSPKDDSTMSSKREIWRGTTCDNGATFSWTPVTQGSTKDNFRPVVPKWDASHTALLWVRGSYTSAQSWSAAIVGTVK